ncbi:hypothetical protein PHISP_04421, partial [Aspergillus sp. HF37]
MSPAMGLKWERLRLAYNGPPLLFSFTSTADGYQLHITDLTHIWTEQCSRKAVLKRAEEQNTTIDPSEDPEQFTVLLQKIGDALRGSPGSSIALNSGRVAGSLELAIATKLPAPLKPLQWALHLSKETPSSSTRLLLLPMLRETAGFEARERALLDQVKHKDWVLAKLFDKIEVMGIDLGTVFPGISGLRAGRAGTTLDQAAKHIKGVAPFDEQRWAGEVGLTAPGSGLAANLVAEASGSGDAEGLSPARDTWWDGLPGLGTMPASPEGDEAEADLRQAPRGGMDVGADAGQETEDDDEFE